MSKRVLQLHDDVPVRLPRTFRLRCCDCGLTHVFVIRFLKNGLGLVVARDKKRTRASRRLKKYAHVKKVKWKNG